MNTMTALVRREFWEHRSLWIAPLVWVAIITVMFTWLILVVIPHEIGGDHGYVGGNMSITDDDSKSSNLNDEQRRSVEAAIEEHAKDKGVTHDEGQQVYALSHFALTGLVSTFACIVVFFYLIDCLYTERRDRSILFWKSLPISDAQVVLSKLAVALVIVPVGAVLLAAAMQVVMSLIVWLRFHGTAIGAVLPDWSMAAWFKSQLLIFVVTLGGILWYAPIAGYLLLMSSWARRNVFLWSVLPPIALVALEGFFFHTTRVLQFVGWRFSGYLRQLHLDPSAMNVGTRHEPGPRLNQIFDSLDMSNLFLNAEVWIGLIVAAGLIYAAIRVRRYRDES